MTAATKAEIGAAIVSPGARLKTIRTTALSEIPEPQ